MDGFSATRRLIRDFKSIRKDPPNGISASPIGDDIFKWEAIIIGPQDSPWDGGIFRLEMIFDEEYPNKPPKIKFITSIFHPNIYLDGSICLDILQNEWSPVFNISGILISIQSLLTDPNTRSPANNEAAVLYNTDILEYNKRVISCVDNSIESAKDLMTL
ncbi:Ubiquitin-conjugating enzyme [Babesia microti strain RI]|uniref:Ubiquitin-conjugating enzyme n=1 Tax=Babesia microti (strain RI) TaxID=1133968 RepID=I7IPG7_BABMR|nr:Ubiquitin-conjugating enzyme [Babesia microti strain RI]CCF72940.1 Ubiquitin-conjugating enzyme [Babesia microti strain RI]|eukprot:XP_012647549.1 Ubiquitin-conjugating enzyme [Babesia microti strain RI]